MSLIQPPPQKVEVKQDKQDKQKEAAEAMTSVVVSAFPEKRGRHRKVMYLWHRFFRVNYLCEETGTVSESHFLRVLDDGRIESKPDSEKDPNQEWRPCGPQ